MRKTKRLHSKICHQSGLPIHYRKSVMSWSFTEGLVRLTTPDIFKPYKKPETPTWRVFGRGSLGGWVPATMWSSDAGIMWELYHRGTEGPINTRSRHIPIQREEEK